MALRRSDASRWGETIRIYAGIPTGGLCLACHGEALVPAVGTAAVGTALDRAYPQDQARSFPSETSGVPSLCPNPAERRVDSFVSGGPFQGRVAVIYPASGWAFEYPMLEGASRVWC